MPGLNTCWVAMSFKKGKLKSCTSIQKGEKLYCVLALGYGVTEGAARKSKPIEALCEVKGNAPEWFAKGMEAAALAPTAMNQQKFKLILEGNEVKAVAGIGFYTKMDLGIVKRNFEAAAGKENFRWK